MEAGLVPVGISALFGLAAIGAVGNPGLIQVGDPRSLPETPVYADALRARTPDEMILAAYFNVGILHQRVLDAGNAQLILDGPEVPPPLPGAPPPPDPWTHSVCAADAVIIGHATGKRVLLTQRETFLFTVSELVVDRWLVPRTGGQTLTMATLGGSVKVGERLISASINGDPLDFSSFWLLTLEKLLGASVFVPSGSPIPLGETRTAKGTALRTSWRTAEARVARIAATCADRR